MQFLCILLIWMLCLGRFVKSQVSKNISQPLAAVAVLVVGESRGHFDINISPKSHVGESISEYLITPLTRDQNFEVDIFICLDTINQTSAQAKHREMVHANNFMGSRSVYWYYDDVVLSSITRLPFGLTKGKLALYRTMRCYERMMGKGLKYMYIIKTRPDLQFFKSVPVLRSLEINRIHMRIKGAIGANFSSFQASLPGCAQKGCTSRCENSCLIFDDQLAIVPQGSLAEVYFRAHRWYMQSEGKYDKCFHYRYPSNGVPEYGFTSALLYKAPHRFNDFSLLNWTAVLIQQKYHRNRNLVHSLMRGEERYFRC
jgi:hypothetical protein